MESIGSARIEGNNTTLLEYIETKLEEKKDVPFGVKEIQNIENAMDFIEENVKDQPINRAFICEIHKMVIDGLPPPPKGEGDKHPGQYRKFNIKINKSLHIPPDFLLVEDYMRELFDFINQNDSPIPDSAEKVTFGLRQSPGIEIAGEGVVFPRYYPLSGNSIAGAFTSAQM